MGSPSFFKIILQSAIDEKKLNLPPKFVRKYGNQLAKTTTFNVPDGRSWEIKVGNNKSDGTTWFGGRGWSEFAAYYSISHAFLMVFDYKLANSCFHVRIFAPTACEISYPGGNHSHHPSVTERDEGEGRRSSLARIRTTVANSFKQQRKKATESGERAIQAAMLLTLYNPSFMIVIRRYNLSSPVAYVPGEFVKVHLGTNCREVIVRDSNSSRGWVIGLNGRESGGLNFGYGWGAFAADTGLEPEDVCVFELVDHGEYDMKVHIFHVSSL